MSVNLYGMLEEADWLPVKDPYAGHLIYREFQRIRQFAHREVKKYTFPKGVSFRIKARKVLDYVTYCNVEQFKCQTMEQLDKFKATVIGYDDRYYRLRTEEGKEIKVSLFSMHSRVKFRKGMLEACPDDILEKYKPYLEGLLDEGVLKLDEVIEMSKKEMVGVPGNVFRYYPDQDCYTKRPYPDILRLQEGYNEMKTKNNSNSMDGSQKEEPAEDMVLLIREIVRNKDSINAESLEYLLTSLVALVGNNDRVSLLLRNILLKDEDEHTEYKTSFFYPADQLSMPDSTYQRKKILKELIGFANARNEGVVYVGITDDKRVVGVQEEMKTFCPNKTPQDFEMEFKNIAKQCTDNAKFAMSLDFKWRRDMDLDGHLVCQITVPEWNGDILLFSGNELYVRHKNTIQHLENQNMIDFIRDYYVKRNNTIIQYVKDRAIS